ncbi:MAG TPA: glycosyltransferase, partial [Flavobacteriales bacterium]|nr:glycosyltransferase [Flavobacteriales bacterium]
MRVSIITVSYNSAATIEDTIVSVINQTWANVEYIVVDGASKDNTLKICDKYKHKITKIVSEPDKGIYDAMNKGLALATGDVIGI